MQFQVYLNFSFVDSTSGGVAVRSQNRTNLRAARVPRHFSKKMATLSLVGPGDIDRSMGEYPMRHVEGSYLVKDKSPNQGTASAVFMTRLYVIHFF